MIDLYTWKTPNGYKASIMLEEVQLPYTVKPIHIGRDDQFAPEYVRINPNSKIPSIVDWEGPDGQPISVFESGAILIYLAKKTGKFLPEEPRAYYEVLQWLMFQMGGVGPMFGQNHHFRGAKEAVPYGIARYAKETERLYQVMDDHFAKQEYFGPSYSIADIATYPWVYRHPRQEIALSRYPNVKRWYDTLSARPAVQKGLAVPEPS